MHILVTNDDGIHAPGIFALQAALRAIPGARISIVAPEQNQSTAGHRLTLRDPLRIHQTALADGNIAHGVTGSPADSIWLSLLGYIKEPVDIILSGINQGPNQGQDITYSGTVTAAMEGAIRGLPSIAFSLDQRSDPDFTEAARFARELVPLVYEQGLPPLTLLNINIPAGKPAGIRVTRQGKRMYFDELVERTDPGGRPYYWIGGASPGGDYDEEGTDLWAVSQGYISITPIQLDMTAYSLMNSIEGWLSRLG